MRTTNYRLFVSECFLCRAGGAAGLNLNDNELYLRCEPQIRFTFSSSPSLSRSVAPFGFRGRCEIRPKSKNEAKADTQLRAFAARGHQTYQWPNGGRSLSRALCTDENIIQMNTHKFIHLFVYSPAEVTINEN